MTCLITYSHSLVYLLTTLQYTAQCKVEMTQKYFKLAWIIFGDKMKYGIIIFGLFSDLTYDSKTQSTCS